MAAEGTSCTPSQSHIAGEFCSKSPSGIILLLVADPQKLRPALAAASIVESFIQRVAGSKAGTTIGRIAAISELPQAAARPSVRCFGVESRLKLFALHTGKPPENFAHDASTLPSRLYVLKLGLQRPMERKPSSRHTIDRIDNDGDYTKDN
ncbi:MAG: hypothetical protein WBX25_29750 [Rhodomicrobium sp.]